MPLIIFLRNRLKYALTYDETKKVTMQRLIKVDGKVRTDITYPAGFMGECGSDWVPVSVRSLTGKCDRLTLVERVLQNSTVPMPLCCSLLNPPLM